MKLSNLSLYCFIPCVLLGCGEGDSFSVGGVSLGGTGLPSTGGNPPILSSPMPAEGEILPDDNPFILWSSGAIEKTCDQINLKMQLINLETGSILETQQGIPLHPNPEENIGVIIHVTNNNSGTTTEYFENCQPSIQIIGQDGQQLATHDNFECAANDLTLAHKPQESATYQYKFNLPNEPTSWSLNYHHIYSLEQNAAFTERKSCDISYPLNVGI